MKCEYYTSKSKYQIIKIAFNEIIKLDINVKHLFIEIQFVLTCY